MTALEVVESLLDPREFARQLIGEPLWSHQADVVMHPARTRVMVCGRQAGKSRTLAVIALHAAFTRRNFRVLIMSAGDDAAKDLLEEIVALASGPLLNASLAEDNKSTVVLSNGSTIRCIPASERQARGKSTDLLILDEAASISDALWRAVRYTVIARPGSRIVMAGTPFGSQDHFFAQTFRLGQNGAEGYASFRWPSQVSPLVDAALLEDWRRTDPEWVYRQEVLAEWVQDQQAYFSADELEQAVADYELLDADAIRELSPWRDGVGAVPVFPAVAGLDYGLRNDANVITLVAALDDHGLNDEILGPGERAYYVPWVTGRAGWAWHDFAAHVADVCTAYQVKIAASEMNGVGDAATSIVQRELDKRRADTVVAGVMIDNRRKQAAMGRLKSLLQQRRLILPRHPLLLRQLNALEFSYTETGAVRIAVRESLGHDDHVLATAHACSCADDRAQAAWRNAGGGWGAQWWERDAYAKQYRADRAAARAKVDAGELEVVETQGGLVVPRRPTPMVDGNTWWRYPPGSEHESAW